MKIKFSLYIFFSFSDTPTSKDIRFRITIYGISLDFICVYSKRMENKQDTTNIKF